MRFVHRHDDAATTVDRLVADNIFHLKDTSFWVTWHGGDFVVKLLRSYCVHPAGRYLRMSPLSCGLVQIL